MNEFTEIDRLCAVFIKYRREHPIRKKWEATPAVENTPIIKHSRKSFSNRCKDGLPEFRGYRKEVNRLTELVAHLIPGIEKRGFTNHHIDHIKSIWFGFKNGLPAEDIANLNNLRMLPYKENMKKGVSCQ